MVKYWSNISQILLKLSVEITQNQEKFVITLTSLDLISALEEVGLRFEYHRSDSNNPSHR